MSTGQAWVALVGAGLLDVAWAVAMKNAQGWTRLGWSLTSLALLAGFTFLLGRALQVLPIGPAYSVRVRRRLRERCSWERCCSVRP